MNVTQFFQLEPAGAHGNSTVDEWREGCESDVTADFFAEVGHTVSPKRVLGAHPSDSTTADDEHINTSTRDAEKGTAHMICGAATARWAGLAAAIDARYEFESAAMRTTFIDWATQATEGL